MYHWILRVWPRISSFSTVTTPGNQLRAEVHVICIFSGFLLISRVRVSPFSMKWAATR